MASVQSNEGEVRKVRLSKIAETGEQGSASIGAMQSRSTSGSGIKSRSGKKVSRVRICNKYPLEEGWEGRYQKLLMKSNEAFYNFFKNNCEHFANYVRSEKWVSDQVKNGIAIAGGVALGALAIGAVASLFSGDEEERKRKERARRNNFYLN